MTKRKSGKLTALLGKNIAARRKAIGLTQDQLAEQVGVDAETISRFERGVTSPSLATLETLSHKLHVSIGELIETSAPAPSSEALTISAVMDGLKPKERKFLMELIRLYCKQHS